MKWKSEYLANLLKLIQSDGTEDNKEFLALVETEERLGSRIEDFINASGMAKYGAELHRPDTEILERQHLTDLYALAMPPVAERSSA